jgi:hypothetical protein
MIINTQNKLIIKDYTKDCWIWKDYDSNDDIRFEISCADDAGSKSLVNFGNYLFQRQKAGIIDVINDSSNQNSDILYILPPSSTNQTVLHGRYIQTAITSTNSKLTAAVESTGSGGCSHGTGTSQLLDQLVSKVRNHYIAYLIF